MDGSLTPNRKVRLALLDVNGGEENRGVPALEKLITDKGAFVKTFDVRGKELPDLNDYDGFIGSGGPNDPNDWGQNTGNPKDNWGAGYFKLFSDLESYNDAHDDAPKNTLLICHSFQLGCKHFGLAELTKRENGLLVGVHEQIVSPYAHLLSTISFGPEKSRFKTFEGRKFQAHRPIYCVDGGGKYLPLCYDDQGALTGFSNWSGSIMGFQFHPEAEPANTRLILHDQQNPKNVAAQKLIVDTHGENALEIMRNTVEEIDFAHSIVSDFVDRVIANKTASKLKIA